MTWQAEAYPAPAAPESDYAPAPLGMLTATPIDRTLYGRSRSRAGSGMPRRLFTTLAQLRGAALALESECWKFRTRSGIYVVSSAIAATAASNSSEEALRQVLESVRQHVGKSASVSETAYGSMMELFNRPAKNKLSIYTHGQYRGCGWAGLSTKPLRWPLR